MPQDRLSNIRVADPVLTNLALGYHNHACVGEVLFPVTTVPKEGGLIPKFGREAFYTHATKRQVRGESNRLDPKNIGDLKYTLEEHDLEYPIDYRENHEAAFDLRAHATHIVKSGLDLGKELVIAEMVTNVANFADENKIVLSGTAQFTDPAADIIGTFEAAKDAVRRIIGHSPNVGVIPKNVFDVMKNHPTLLARLSHDSLRKTLRIEDLRDILDVKGLVVGEATYMGDADKLIDIWKNDVVLAYTPEKQANLEHTVYNPAFGYNLRLKNGVNGGTSNGLDVDRYVENGGKVEVIRATEIAMPVIVGNDAGYLIKNAIGGA